MEQILSAAHRSAEDGCSYEIYPPVSQDGGLSTALADILAYTLSLAGEYIWQREAFNLSVDSKRRCLSGETRVGDCIEDEWFIVWLLLQISIKYPGCAAQVSDVDGQFLLIEAAETLPKWVSPDNSDHRVWIHNGNFHLVPLEHTSPPPPDLEDPPQGYISISDALRLVQNTSIPTEAPQQVQQAVYSRVEKYPEAITTSHLHHTLAYIPQDIAAILNTNGQLIAPAVTAFYERDPLQLKTCQIMKRFPPHPSCLSRIRMTRVLYAQLMGQKFFPPRPFERAQWFSHTQPDSIQHRQKDIGMKIACGFEMLYDDTKDRLKSHKVPTRPDQDMDFANDPSYQRFVGNLDSLGYFQGQLPESQKYAELLRQAQLRFTDMRADSVRLPAFAEQAELALKQAKHHADAPTPPLEEDSDDWMQMDEAALEELLKSKQGSATGQSAEEAGMEQHAQNLTGLAAKFEDFIQGKGDVEGALFDDEQDDDADPASDEEMDQLGPSTEQKQRDMDRLVPELPDDQWGRKEETETKVPIAPHELPKPRLEPEKYDGASDSEPSEDDEEEANLQEVGEEGTEGQDINMNEEMHEFLRFTREALGLTEDQYQDILKSRSARGAFVPGDELTNARPMDMDMPPPPQSTAHTNSTSSTRKPDAPSTQPSSFHLNAPQKNPKLDSFEALMNAMDGALEQAKSQTQQNQKTAATGKSKATDPDDAALEGGMDAELAELLKHDPDDEDDHLNPSQYNLLKNLLASFDSQEGAAGPVSNLAGRLDPNVRLPRNQSA